MPTMMSPRGSLLSLLPLVVKGQTRMVGVMVTLFLPHQKKHQRPQLSKPHGRFQPKLHQPSQLPLLTPQLLRINRWNSTCLWSETSMTSQMLKVRGQQPIENGKRILQIQSHALYMFHLDCLTKALYTVFQWVGSPFCCFQLYKCPYILKMEIYGKPPSHLGSGFRYYLHIYIYIPNPL